MNHDMKADMSQNIFPKDVPVKAFPEEMPVQVYPDELRKFQVPFKEFPPLSPPTVDSVTDTAPDEIPRRDGPGGEPEDTYLF